jgi:hypothetical protein
MIKPYYKDEHIAKFVEVEGHGVIDLTKLPVRIRLDREGIYEIGWSISLENGKQRKVLSEYGGRNQMDFGGMNLGVLKEIE